MNLKKKFIIFSLIISMLLSLITILPKNVISKADEIEKLLSYSLNVNDLIKQNPFDDFSVEFSSEMLTDFNNKRYLDQTLLEKLNIKILKSDSNITLKYEDFNLKLSLNSKEGTLNDEPIVLAYELKEKNDVIYLSIDDLNLLGFSYALEENIVINRPFVSKRIFVKSDNLVLEDAKNIVNGYKNFNVVQFDSEYQAKLSYENLKINNEVYINSVFTKNGTITTNEESEVNSWGYGFMGIDSYKQYLSELELNDVYVAVIDTGIDTDNELFNNRIQYDLGKNFSTDENLRGEYEFQDYNGHGTAISSIICELTSENVKIVPIKLMNEEGKFEFVQSISALEYLNLISESTKISCANLSFSGEYSSTTYEYEEWNTQITNLTNKGIICTVASGDENKSLDNVCPANISSVLTVGKVELVENFDLTTANTENINNQNLSRSFDLKEDTSSNYGLELDLVAPGKNIVCYGLDNELITASGSSFASAHVSACVALICSDTSKSYENGEVMEILNQNAIDLGSFGFDNYYGNGFVNIEEVYLQTLSDLSVSETNNQIYASSLTFQITSPETDIEIYYTLNGEKPSLKNLGSTTFKYESEIKITSTCIVKAMGLTKEYIENLEDETLLNDISNIKITATSKILTHYYILNSSDIENAYELEEREEGYFIKKYNGLISSLTIPSQTDGKNIVGISSFAFENSTITSLTIPTSINYLDSYAFANAKNLITITINSSLETLPDYCFANCTKLTTATLSNITELGKYSFYNCHVLCDLYVDRLLSVNEGAFYNCISITSIELTYVQELSSYAFYNCKSLYEIDSPYLRIINNYCFSNCVSLTLDTASLYHVSYIGIACFANTKTTSVEFPNLQTISMNSFSNNPNLTIVNLEMANYVGAYAFANCSNLTEVILPLCQTIGNNAFLNDTNLVNINMDKVVQICFGAFKNCIGLTEINIDYVEIIDPYAFENCNQIVELNLPSAVEIGSRAFANCLKLESCNFSTCIENVVDTAFLNCEKLQFEGCLYVYKNSVAEKFAQKNNFNYEYINSEDYLTYVLTDDGIKITGVIENTNDTIVVPSIIDGQNIVEIGDYAFENCQKITYVNIPSLKVIGYKSFIASSIEKLYAPNVETIGACAFEDCQNLKDVNIQNVKQIGDYAFIDCDISEIKIANSDCEFGNACLGYLDTNGDKTTLNVIFDFKIYSLADSNAKNYASNNVLNFEAYYTEYTEYDYEIIDNEVYILSAKNKDSLTYGISIPETIESLPVVSIGSSAFAYTGITQIVLPSTIREIKANAFEYCEKLTSINLENVESIGEKAFYNCGLLQSASLSNVITLIDLSVFEGCGSLESIVASGVNKINDNAFKDCAKLISITFGDIESIGDYAFNNCSSLDTLTFNYATKIGNGAFMGCSNLQEVVIPNLTEIPEFAFANCISINSYESETITQIGNNAFDGCEALLEVNFPNALSVGKYCFRNNILLRDCYLNKLTVLDDYIFNNCIILKTLLSAPITQIGTSALEGCTNIEFSEDFFNEVLEIGENALNSCISLKVVNAEKCTRIQKNAFFNCSNLETIKIDSIISIGNRAFENCYNLTQIENYKLKNVGAYAFVGCDKLTKISMPFVETVDQCAFMNSGITDIIFGRNIKSIEKQVHSTNLDVNIYGYNLTVSESYAEKNSLTFITLELVSVQKDLTVYVNGEEQQGQDIKAKLGDEIELKIEVKGYSTYFKWYRYADDVSNKVLLETNTNVLNITARDYEEFTYFAEIYSWDDYEKETSREIVLKIEEETQMFTVTLINSTKLGGTFTAKTKIQSNGEETDFTSGNQVLYGTTLILDLVPYTYYYVNEIKINGITVENNTEEGDYRFVLDFITEDTVVDVYFSSNDLMSVILINSEDNSVINIENKPFVNIMFGQTYTLPILENYQTQEYSYTFSHWEDEEGNIVESAVITQNRTFSAIFTKEYRDYVLTVKYDASKMTLSYSNLTNDFDFSVLDGMQIATASVKYNDEIYLQISEKDKNKLSKIYVNSTSVLFENNKLPLLIEGTTIVEFEFLPIYTVNFFVEEELYSVQEVVEGDLIASIMNPQKETSEGKTYEFEGWKFNEEIIDLSTYLVEQNLDLKASFKVASVIKYGLVINKTGDGRVLVNNTEYVEGITYNYNDSLIIKFIPDENNKIAIITLNSVDIQIPSNKEFTLSLTVNRTNEISVVYSQYNEYVVTFMNGESVYLSKIVNTDYPYVSNSSIPYREADSQYTYTFKGWAEENELNIDCLDLSTFEIEKNTILYAIYSVSLNSYEVTLSVNNEEYGSITYDNDLSIEDQIIKYYGEKIKINATANYGYQIAYLLVNGDRVIIQSNPIEVEIKGTTSIEVVFREAGIGEGTYLVIFAGEKGEILSYQYVTYPNNYAVYNGQEDFPKDYKDEKYVYTFVGWKNSNTGNVIQNDDLTNFEIVSDTTLTAYYSVELREYDIQINIQNAVEGTVLLNDYAITDGTRKYYFEEEFTLKLTPIITSLINMEVNAKIADDGDYAKTIYLALKDFEQTYTVKNDMIININFDQKIGITFINKGKNYAYNTTSLELGYVSLPDNPTYIAKDLVYDFRGWSLTETGEELINFATTKFTENTEVYAIYQTSPRYYDITINLINNYGIVKFNLQEINQSVIESVVYNGQFTLTIEPNELFDIYINNELIKYETKYPYELTIENVSQDYVYNIEFKITTTYHTVLFYYDETLIEYENNLYQRVANGRYAKSPDILSYNNYLYTFTYWYLEDETSPINLDDYQIYEDTTFKAYFSLREYPSIELIKTNCDFTYTQNGEILELEVLPIENYEIKNIKVNSVFELKENYAIIGNKILLNITKEIKTIEVICEEIIFKVVLNVENNEEIFNVYKSSPYLDDLSTVETIKPSITDTTYTFKHWSTEKDGESGYTNEELVNLKIEKDITFYAVFTPSVRMYSTYFTTNGNGLIYANNEECLEKDTKEFAYNSILTLKVIPNEHYVISKIIINDIEHKINETIKLKILGKNVVNVEFVEEIYEVEFYINKDNIIKQTTDTISIPTEVSKPRDEQYTYEFKGWSLQENGQVIGDFETYLNENKILENTIFYAIYENILNDYEIIFFTENGQELLRQNVKYGSKITTALILPSNPQKSSDSKYDYEFAGWISDNEILSNTKVCTKEESYYPIFTASLRQFSISYTKQGNGTVELSSTLVQYGEEISILIKSDSSKIISVKINGRSIEIKNQDELEIIGVRITEQTKIEVEFKNSLLLLVISLIGTALLTGGLSVAITLLITQKKRLKSNIQPKLKEAIKQNSLSNNVLDLQKEKIIEENDLKEKFEDKSIINEQENRDFGKNDLVEETLNLENQSKTTNEENQDTVLETKVEEKELKNSRVEDVKTQIENKQAPNQIIANKASTNTKSNIPSGARPNPNTVRPFPNGVRPPMPNGIKTNMVRPNVSNKPSVPQVQKTSANKPNDNEK